MAREQNDFFTNEPQIKGLHERRKTEILRRGLYYFEDFLDIEGVLPAEIITGAGWLLEIFEISAGEIFFQSGKREIRPNGKNIGVFYAPFNFTRPRFFNTTARIQGIAGQNALAEKFLQKSFAFETDFSGKPEKLEQIIEILESRRNPQFVEAHPNASLLTLKAKKLIDENYRIFPMISRIARRLNVSHEHLTRQFKKDFSITPSAYLHQIRISDAIFRLSQGEKIIDVSGDVGYNDLSRFYKQFRKSTTKSPGFCQKTRTDIKKRQDRKSDFG